MTWQDQMGLFCLKVVLGMALGAGGTALGIVAVRAIRRLWRHLRGDKP